MKSPISLSVESADALQELRERREVNTVILRYADTPRVLVPELEGNLTHEELLRALPSDAARLVVHDLSFATREGARRHERLLILWAPAAAEADQEEPYTAGYTSLQEFLKDVRVHITAGGADQLEYRRLVTLAG